MKKVQSLFQVIVVATLTFSNLFAQEEIFIQPYSSTSFDTRGINLNYLTPAFGVHLGTTINNGGGFLGLIMESNNSYPYSIRNNEGGYDKKTIKVTSLSFSGGLNISEEKSDKFTGQLLGLVLGVGFPGDDAISKPVAQLKLFTQLNYTFLKLKANKYHLGIFFRPSFNYLYLGSGIPTMSIDAGIRFAIRGDNLEEDISDE